MPLLPYYQAVRVLNYIVYIKMFSPLLYPKPTLITMETFPNPPIIESNTFVLTCSFILIS